MKVYLEPDLGSVFDEKLRELLEKLEQAYNRLSDRVSQVSLWI